MYPIGVVGPGSKRLTKRLTEFLAEYGRVSVITGDRRSSGEDDETTTDGGAAVTETTPGEGDDLEAYRSAGAASVYELNAGNWRAAGGGMTEREALYAVAPACEFCVVENPPDAVSEGLSRIVLGDRMADGSDGKSGGDPDGGRERSSNAGVAADADPETSPNPEPGSEFGSAGGAVLATAANPEAIDLDEVRDTLEATEPVETIESLVERAKSSPRAPESGAIATFTGRVRAQEDVNDTPTEYLKFEKYEGVAGQRMAAISTELEERDGVHEVLMHHRSGRIEYGEDIVFVVVLAGHRGEAFRTVEDGIDRLKAEVPIFKKEVTVDEQFWVHDRP